MADMVTLVLLLINILPDVQTPSPVVELLLILNSLLSTENSVVLGLTATDQLLGPLSTVVPLGRVKSSSDKIPLMALLTVTVVFAVLVQPLAGLVTVKL